MLACMLYLECGSHICSVLCVKYVYTAPCSLFDTSDFICGICMCMHFSYMHVEYLACMVYMPSNYINKIAVMQKNAFMLA